MKTLTIINNLQLPKSIYHEIFSKDSQVLGFLDNKKSEFDQWFSSVANFEIESFGSWVNYIKYTPGLINGYKWHNEKGLGGADNTNGTWAGIIWISGDVNCGGNLLVLDDDEIKEVIFNPNTAVIIPATMLHRVEHYYGKSDRISLNFTFNLK